MRYGSVVLSFVLGTVSFTSQAPAQPVWNDGRPFNEIYCGLDKPYGTVQVGYGGEKDPASQVNPAEPRIGDPYFARIKIVKPLDCPSGNRPWEIYLRVPIFSFIAASATSPIRCFESVGGAAPVELPAPECATTMPQADSVPSSDSRPAWNFRPSAKKALIVKPGSTLEIIIPMRSKRALRPEDGSFMVPFGNFEGTGSWGEAHATVAVTIADRPIEIEPLPPENVMPYTVDLRVKFWHLYRAAKGNIVFFDTDGTQVQTMPVDLRDAVAWQILPFQLIELDPNTEYRWKAVLQTEAQMIESPLQTVRTINGPPRPMTPSPPGSPPTPTMPTSGTPTTGTPPAGTPVEPGAPGSPGTTVGPRPGTPDSAGSMTPGSAAATAQPGAGGCSVASGRAPLSFAWVGLGALALVVARRRARARTRP
jgi:hypothetical protein